MNKLARFANKPVVKKVFGLFMCTMMMFAMAIPSFALEGDITGIDTSEIMTSITSALGVLNGALSISSILQIVSIGLALAVGFFLFWWGIRKLVRVVRKAFASGKISV